MRCYLPIGQVEKNLLSEVLDPHVYDPTIRPDGKNGTGHFSVSVYTSVEFLAGFLEG